jgi:hypothetical protein
MKLSRSFKGVCFSQFAMWLFVLGCQQQVEQSPEDFVLGLTETINAGDLEGARLLACNPQGIYADALIDLTSFVQTSDLEKIDIHQGDQNYWKDNYDSMDEFLKAREETGSGNIEESTPYDWLYSVIVINAMNTENEIPLQVWRTEDIYSRDVARYEAILNKVNSLLSSIDESDPGHQVLVSQKSRAEDLKPVRSDYSTNIQCVRWHTIDVESIERRE